MLENKTEYNMSSDIFSTLPNISCEKYFEELMVLDISM